MIAAVRIKSRPETAAAESRHSVGRSLPARAAATCELASAIEPARSKRPSRFLASPINVPEAAPAAEPEPVAQ